MRLLHQGDHKLQLKHRGKIDFPLHLQNAVELLLLTSGKSTVQCDGRKYILNPGDFLILFPNQVHGFEESGDSVGYVMIIPLMPYLAAYKSILTRKRPVEPILRKGSWEHTGLDKLLELACNSWKNADDNIRQGYVMVIMGTLLSLARLTDMYPDNSTALEAAMVYLNNHYKEPVSRKELAKAIGYNESYISHIFSEMLNITLSEYLTNLRIHDAARILQNSTMPVSQIAGVTGFGSIRSFNRAFTHVMGLSPTQYRKRTTEAE